jgi:carbamoyl-phosphate synthase large subunit
VLGPEMRSTGEVMASGADFATAFAKAERAAGRRLPPGGRAFLSVRDADKVAVVPVAQALAALGFDLVATTGTASALELAGIVVERVEKGTAVVELVRSGLVDLVVNTPQGRNARRDGYAIREAAVVARVPCMTTLAVARAAVDAIVGARAEEPVALQQRHSGLELEEALRAAS